MHLYFLLCTSAPTERIRARAKAFLSASWVIIVQQFSRREGQHDVTRGRKRGAALRAPRAHKSVYYNNVVSGHSRSLLREMGTQERALSFNREDSRGEDSFLFSKTMKTLKGFKGLTHKLFQKICCKSKIVDKIQSTLHVNSTEKANHECIADKYKYKFHICFIIRAQQYRTFRELSPR